MADGRDNDVRTLAFMVRLIDLIVTAIQRQAYNKEFLCSGD